MLFDTDWAFKHRAFISMILLSALFVVIIIWVLNLQIKHYKYYSDLSYKNCTRKTLIIPARGKLLDRNGIELAKNVTAYRLVFNANKVSKTSLLDYLHKHHLFLDKSEASLLTKNVYGNWHVLQKTLNSKDLAKLFASSRYLLEGITVHACLEREYPLGDAMSHVIGYVQEDKDIVNIIPKWSGVVGLEAAYDLDLTGRHGEKISAYNAFGKFIALEQMQAASSGDNIYLTIDSRLQTKARDLFAEYTSGALVALDIHTGDIIAMYSHPGFDSNSMSNNFQDYYKNISTSLHKPFYNRVTHGLYPLASLIKPFIAFQGLRDNYIDLDQEIYDTGIFYVGKGSRGFTGWKPKGHGWTNLEKAIYESCDGYFYNLALKMGIDNIAYCLQDFGFGEKTGIELLGEAKGLLPTKAWKKEKYGQPWYLGETVISGIGQGYIQVTLLQIVQALSLLASDETELHGPHLRLDYGDIMVKNNTIDYSEVKATLKSFMHNTVNYEDGTAYKSFINNKYRNLIAGKTGTAQVTSKDEQKRYTSIPYELRDHSLFMGYMPYDSPRVAVVVIVEHGKGSAKIASDFLQYYWELESAK